MCKWSVYLVFQYVQNPWNSAHIDTNYRFLWILYFQENVQSMTTRTTWLAYGIRCQIDAEIHRIEGKVTVRTRKKQKRMDKLMEFRCGLDKLMEHVKGFESATSEAIHS